MIKIISIVILSAGVILLCLGYYFLSYDIFIWGLSVTGIGLVFSVAYLKSTPPPPEYDPALQQKDSFKRRSAGFQSKGASFFE